MKAICEALAGDCLPSPTEDIWRKSEVGFSNKWNFPNACGALDGKHVRIRAPAVTGSIHFNYKAFFSMVLLAICNYNYMFTGVEIGSAGSESDGGILMRSNMGKRLASDTIGLPKPKPISGNLKNMPHVILGDSGFPLKPYLMVPFKGDFIPKKQKIFNYRLSRARMDVENSFGILAARWRIFHTPIDADLELVKQITLTSVILHNFLVMKKDMNGMTVDHTEGDVTVPGSWSDIVQGDTGMSNLGNQGSNNYSVNASEIRQNFNDYFLDEGKVGWQEAHVSR
jgi:DDE superfamily endonuclease